MNITMAGMAWYERHTYPAILKMMVDARQLPDTYEEWHEKAKALERELQKKGHRIKRVLIAPDLFAAWCREHGLEANAQARSRYAGDHAYMSMLEGE